MIASFHGEYRFLSNFFPAEVTLRGAGKYASVEHAYQASKCFWPSDRLQFRQPGVTPGQAKRMGKRVLKRHDWDQIKLTVMRNLVMEKFRHPDLRQLLLGTGDEELVEGNTWGDTFWGVCDGEGENWLGRILMEVRGQLRSEGVP